MYKKYTVEQMGSSKFLTRLGDVALPYLGNMAPIQNILCMLKDPPYSCKSVVFEEDYIDEVYQDEYSTFYSKVFKSYPARCIRLHFFDCVIPKKTRTNFGRHEASYLGFMVLRPTDLQRVGRTILQPKTTNQDAEFICCQAPFSAHILGHKFSIQAMPFIQQDTQVGACAQASLWMLSRYMSKRFGYRHFSPSEINEFAKAKMGGGRHLPAEHGLTMSQMLEALEAMGFSAIAYQKQFIDNFSSHVETAFPINTDADGAPINDKKLDLCRTAKLADITYRYIESGLPVIFGTSNHALVGIGHKYEHKTKAKIAIERIPSFFVNNDNRGCYREMPMFGPCCEYTFEDVDSLIAVTPQEATLRGESAEDMAIASIQEFLAVVPNPTYKKTYKDLLLTVRPDFAPWFNQLEYRTYLIPSVVFQKDIRVEMNTRNLDRKVGDKLLRLDYPKYIWLTEVSSSTLLNMPNKADRKCLGRVLVDSTAPSSTRGVIAMHFADILSISDRQKGKEQTDFDIYPKSTPFYHRLWKC